MNDYTFKSNVNMMVLMFQKKLTFLAEDSRYDRTPACSSFGEP